MDFMAGFYYEQRNQQVEKVANFYLPNKIEFHSSIGLDFENRLSKNRCVDEEIIILAHFCEIVGPVPLIIYPIRNNLFPKVVDSIVMKAMSADYQLCEQGEIALNNTTQTLVLDCSIPFFVHYFTLWDIHARGYVRPCCIIVCCRDKVRARELFISEHAEMEELLKPLLAENLASFYHDLHKAKDMITEILFLNRDNKSEDLDELNLSHLSHLSHEYSQLITSIEDQVDNCDTLKRPKSCDLLLDVNLFSGSIKHELRSIFTIMKSTEADCFKLLMAIAKKFTDASVSESFSLAESGTPWKYLFRKSITKFDMDYFSTPFTVDKQHFLNSHSVNKPLHLCMCNILTDKTTIDNIKRDSKMDVLFPNLMNFKAGQCIFVSQQCKQLGTTVVIKLISCLFNQCHLIIFINNQQCYTPLLNLLQLFLPISYNLRYFPAKTEWPTLEQLKESLVFFLNKDKASEMPHLLKGLVATYDYSTNQFICGPTYTKGYLINFFDSFKHLEYNHMYLETIVKIMLLNYMDMIYQWISLLGRRDRRWITEDYLIKLGYSSEDIAISEKLTLFVLQTLFKSKDTFHEPNYFLSSESLFPISSRKDCK